MPAETNPKRLNRKQRVALAKRWAESVTTTKKIKAYRKYFGVDKCCAAKELIMAGVPLAEKYAKRWATRHERRAEGGKARRESRSRRAEVPPLLGSDYHFYYIAGIPQVVLHLRALQAADQRFTHPASPGRVFLVPTPAFMAVVGDQDPSERIARSLPTLSIDQWRNRHQSDIGSGFV
jgi:hypothetical protein